MSDRVISHGKVPAPQSFLELPVAFESVQAGFPAPNGGYIDGHLDVNQFLVSHPSSTFVYQVAGDSMIEAGIMPDDFVLVDASIEPKTGDVVVAMIDGEYTIKKLQTHPHPQLIPCNREYSPIEIGEYTEVTIIGPVISVIRKYH